MSPDGTRLAFQNAVAAGGYDLNEVMIDRAAWIPAAHYVDDRPNATVIRDDEAVVCEHGFYPEPGRCPAGCTRPTHTSRGVRAGGDEVSDE